MQSLSRRHFIAVNASLLFAFCASNRHGNTRSQKSNGEIITVNGSINASAMGKTLIHEHILVDFIGADKISKERWNVKDVIRKVSPYVEEAKVHGVVTLFDCTPAYLGRDIQILQRLSKEIGINIVTNTGYYGAVNNKYLPAHAHKESADELATRWIQEFRDGIDGTTVRPGFIKIGVDGNSLSPLHRKLVHAACITHKATGLTISSHTGKASLALQQLAVLDEMNVSRDAFVWVHAQAEEDEQQYLTIARSGTWISLDGFGEESLDKYIRSLKVLKSGKLLDKVLISHDAGWYRPGEPNGGAFTPYTRIFTHLLPALKQSGFDDGDLELLLIQNPANAYQLKVIDG